MMKMMTTTTMRERRRELAALRPWEQKQRRYVGAGQLRIPNRASLELPRGPLKFARPARSSRLPILPLENEWDGSCVQASMTGF